MYASQKPLNEAQCAVFIKIINAADLRLLRTCLLYLFLAYNSTLAVLPSKHNISHLRRPKIQSFYGAAYPQTPLVGCALHTTAIAIISTRPLEIGWLRPCVDRQKAAVHAQYWELTKPQALPHTHYSLVSFCKPTPVHFSACPSCDPDTFQSI